MLYFVVAGISDVVQSWGGVGGFWFFFHSEKERVLENEGMMKERMDEAKKKLIEKKARILAQERVLDERKKRAQIKEFIAIGKLAEQAGISGFEKNVLLGAFLEIAKKIGDANFVEACKSAADQFNDSSKNIRSHVAIKFKGAPDLEVAKSLRKLGFHWNRFRKEFYGQGTIESLKGLVGGVECSFEEISN